MGTKKTPAEIQHEAARILEVADELLTNHQRKVLNSVIEAHGNKQAAADALGMCRSSLRQCYNFAQKKAVGLGYSPEHDMHHPTTPPFAVKGTSNLYGADGELKLSWVKTDRDKAAFMESVRQQIHEIARDLPPVRPIKVKRVSGIHERLHSFIPLGDPHIGMLAWGQETGRDWDLQLAEEAYREVFNDVVCSAERSKELTIIDLGDFWHSDNYDLMTSRSGFRVDQDGRYSKMIMVGFRILMMMIDSGLRHHNKVNVKILPGNHDPVGSMFLRTSLYLIYKNEPRVEVDLSPSVFQYTQWGRSAIGYHHGDKCPMNQLPLVMANDQPEMWAQCHHRTWYTGHNHKDSKMIYKGADEFQGCTVESFRIIPPEEEYAHASGRRFRQDMKVIVHDIENGEIARHRRSVS